MISTRAWRLPMLVALCTSLFAAAPAPTSHAAAPWIVIVHGDVMPERAVIANWHENLELLASIDMSVVTDTMISIGRPYLNLAMFWGGHWKKVAESPEELARLRPEQATQYGRFYPAWQGANALAMIGPALGRDYVTVGRIAVGGLALLDRYDVPIRLDE